MNFAYFATAKETSEGVIFSGHAHSGETTFAVEALLPADRAQEPKIMSLTHCWGPEATGHEALEAAELASKKVSCHSMLDQLLTKKEMLEAGDWYRRESYDVKRGRFHSPSLDVSVYFNLADGSLHCIHGAMVKHGALYHMVYGKAARPWAERLFRSIALGMAMRIAAPAEA